MVWTSKWLCSEGKWGRQMSFACQTASAAHLTCQTASRWQRSLNHARLTSLIASRPLQTLFHTNYYIMYFNYILLIFVPWTLPRIRYIVSFSRACYECAEGWIQLIDIQDDSVLVPSRLSCVKSWVLSSCCCSWSGCPASWSKTPVNHRVNLLFAKVLKVQMLLILSHQDEFPCKVISYPLNQ